MQQGQKTSSKKQLFLTDIGQMTESAIKSIINILKTFFQVCFKHCEGKAD